LAHPHERGRRRGDAGRHPPPGLRNQAIDAPRLGERAPRSPPALREREAQALSRRVLAMQIQDRLFIAGRFVPAADGATLPSLNPHDCSHLAEVAMAGKTDVDAAVEAAHKAFPAWSRTSAAERGRLLYKLADRIEANAEEL